MEFCRDPFFNSTLTWNTTDPTLTQCMQDTLLTGLPCLMFFLSEPFWILYKVYFYSIKSFPVQRKIGFLFCMKVFLNLLLVFNMILQISLKSHDEFYGSEVFRFMAMISTIIAILICMSIEKWNMVHTSPPMFIFWLLMAACKLPMLKEHVEYLMENSQDAVFWVLALTYYPVFLLLLVFHCWSDMDRSTVEAPESSASFPSTIFYTWIDYLIWQGLKAPLTLEQVPKQPMYVSVTYVVQDFLNHWNKKVSSLGKTFIKNTDPAKEEAVRIFSVLLGTYGMRLFLIFVLGVVNFTLVFIGPIMLKLLIKHVQSDEEAWKGFTYVAIIFLNANLQSLLNHQFLQQTVISAQQIRASLSSMIYRKAMKLSNAAKKKFTMGEITNFISTDIQTLGITIPYMNNVWVAPLKICIAMYFLYQELKMVTFIGVGIMAVLLPLNYWGSVIIKRKRKDQMEAKDGRIKLMNEVLMGMKVLKLYAWEIPFMKRINAIRLTEVQLMKTLAKVYAISNFTLNSGPTLITIACFGLFTVFQPDEILTADKIFVSIALFNIIRMSMVMLPWAIVALLKAFVSLRRIEAFLNANELDSSNVGKDVDKDENAIEIKEGSFTWTEDPERITLKEVNLDVPKGSLVAVVGVVGAGKSSLLSAILGEMEKVSGSMDQVGTIAYVPQQAWIQNMSLKNNILFESDFEDGKYKRTLDHCALNDDLEMLIGGDETEIGENGINLSGGQKQRVSVARAVYSDSDVYLLDDPLSAVDAHVGKHLFDHVFSSKSGVLKDKTRILVTHSVSFLDQMDQILVLRDGMIAERGTYSELKASKGAFSEFLAQYANKEKDEDEAAEERENKEDKSKEMASMSLPKARAIPVRTRKLSQTLDASPMSPMIRYLGTSADTPIFHDDILAEEVEDEEESEKPATESKAPSSQVVDANAGRLVEDEEAMIGKVNWKVYLSYLKDLGNIISTISFLLYLVGQGLESGSSYWLAFWADANDVNPARANDNTPFYLGIYSGIGLLQIVIMIIREIVLFISCADASFIIHDKLLSRVVRSPMSFFDTNPIGRIVNRFSSDIGTVDDAIPFQISLFLECFSSIVTVLALICYSLPIFMTVILPLAIIYYFIQRCYISTTRQLQRLESIAISPIFAHFTESLNGVQSIRAYKQEERFIQESEKRVDKGVQLHYMCVMMNRWLGVRIEFLANLVVFFVSLFAVLSRGTISAGLTGLAISFSLNVTGMLNWLIRSVCDMETDAVALERILEYTENPQEADWDKDEDLNHPQFPSEGQIEFTQYQTRYREGLDLVLKDVSMKIQPREKIGICGRTGAGKSSLTLALFRIIEPVSGKIILDGVDVNTIGLHKLRAGLTIIPQDPVLFTGNIRFNLDPTEEHTDSQIWRALEHANLKAHVTSLSNGLDHELLIKHVQSDEEAWKGFTYVAIIFLNANLQSLLNHQFLQQTVISAQQIRASLSSMIYRKAMKLSNAAKKKFTMGEITNFISTDIQTLGITIPYMNNVWVAPLKICIAMYFLYQELKMVTFIGVGIMAVLLPLNYWGSVIIKRKRKDQMEAKDGRIKLMNEVLMGMKVLKLYAWEIPFMKRINAIRLTEVQLMKTLAKVYAISNFTLNSGPTLITIACFGLFTVFQPDEILTADKIFVSIALFNIIRMSMVMLPWAIVALLKAFVSLRRIEAFLNANELDSSNVGKDVDKDENAIEIKEGSFTWTEDPERITLKEVNLDVPKGSLVAVVGVVGAGKSSLLSAILGEMEKVSGSMDQVGTIAYVPQQAWIQNMSLKNNILFESDFEDGKYKRTLDHCALNDDLEMLIGGDETEIGENGINLSGGQKQRVSVARAVYSDSDVYLLDDPLSAVDAHVGKHLFDHVFSSKSGVLKDKTRILVTHSVSFLDQMDQILVLRDGMIAERGTYSELKASKGAFSEFLAQYANKEKDEDEAAEERENKEDKSKEMASMSLPKARAIPVRTRKLSQTLDASPMSPMIRYLGTSADTPIFHDDILAEEVEDEEESEKPATESKAPSSQVVDANAGRLVEDEEAMIGKVNWKVYLSYLKDLGNIISTISFLLYLVGQGLESGSSYWLAFWADANDVNPARANDNTPFYLGIYSGIGLLQIVIMIIREIVLFISCADASFIIHDKLLSRVVRSPMSFFDTNPIGRIVNRFSSDIGTVDDAIPFQISLFLECFSSIVTVLALICYSLPIFMTVILPLAIIYYFIQRCYISTTRQLQRLESIAISPIFAHFTESLNGVQSIRAYKQEERFIQESEKRVDKGVQLHYMCVMMNRWLGVRIEFLANLVVFFVSLFAVLSRGTISAGLTGLAISFSLNVTGMLNWLIRSVCDMETDAVALESIGVHHLR
eukprot:snap_masked-scaffold61_size441589-processed-gene-3.13 protein:Tk06313 transcript:snap_masked-scaffold61_size441589-processed-gene-3.13-mRNA-1 annotation:"abc transporter"